MTENTTSPNEETVQPDQTTSVESVATETTTVQPEKDTNAKEGQEGVKDGDIAIPELPEDLPEEGKEYIKLSLQKARREMQKAFTKKTQEIAQLRKETQSKIEAFEQLKEYIPVLEQLKAQNNQVEEPDLDSMDEDERLQHLIKSTVEREVAPYKEQLLKLKAEEVSSVSSAQEEEAKEYANNIGIVYDDFVDAMIEEDSKDPGRCTWKQLLRIVAGDEIDKVLTEKGKMELLKSLKEKKANTPPSSGGGEPVHKITSIADAAEFAYRKLTK